MSNETDEDRLRELFAVLRTQISETLGGFEDRVRDRIALAEAPEGPIASDAALGVVAQVIGLLLRILGGGRDALE